MNFKISFFVILLFVQFSSFAQQNKSTVDWQKFLPQSKVDKIVLFNTNGIHDQKLNAHIYSSFLFSEDYSDSLTTLLPQYFENKRVVTDSLIINEIVTSLPKDSCVQYPTDRCIPQYRDIILFYNNNKLVFTLKICMECPTTTSIPFSAESKCLANKLSIVYMYVLGFDLFGDRRW